MMLGMEFENIMALLAKINRRARKTKNHNMGRNKFYNNSHIHFNSYLSSFQPTK
jgi:hypothetical protein